MGNKAVLIPFVLVAVLVASAAFLFNPTPAAASSRDSVASGILDMLTQRLCDRQEKMGGRVRLIHPSKCESEPPPPAEPTVTLTAEPATITAGGSTTLEWTSENADSCEAFLGWTGEKALNGSEVVSPAVTTTYQLDCTNESGVGSDDAVVTVIVEEPDAPTVEITADPMTIIEGASSTLAWNSENVDSCTASGGWSGSKALDDDESVSPTETTIYTITCEGNGESASDSVTVTVNQPDPEDPTLDLTADPTTINEGSASLLSWETTNATSCEKSGGWSGATTTSGTFSVSPTATTTYSMECTGPGGTVNDSVTVNVILVPDEPDAPTVDLVAAPTVVNENSAGNATTTLTWTTTNATTCTASGGAFTGSKATSSTEILTPTATTTYMLECSGPGGTANDSVTVDFVPEAQQQAGKLLITEFIYDLGVGQGSEPGNEWVELYNGTNADIDLTNYYIHDSAGSDKLPSVMLPVGTFAIITGSSTTETLWEGMGMPTDTLVLLIPNASIGSNGFAIAGDYVWLESSASTTVDAVSYGSNTTAFSPSVSPVSAGGHSLARSSITLDTDTASDWIDKEAPNPGQ